MSWLARYYKAAGVPEPVKLAEHTRQLWMLGHDVDEQAIAQAQRDSTRVIDRSEVDRMIEEREGAR
jgi:hypothetical protein